MSNPEYWWCVKNCAGILMASTARKDRGNAEYQKMLGESVVRIRIVEEKRRGK